MYIKFLIFLVTLLDYLMYVAVVMLQHQRTKKISLITQKISKNVNFQLSYSYYYSK